MILGIKAIRRLLETTLIYTIIYYLSNFLLYIMNGRLYLNMNAGKTGRKVLQSLHIINNFFTFLYQWRLNFTRK